MDIKAIVLGYVNEISNTEVKYNGLFRNLIQDEIKKELLKNGITIKYLMISLCNNRVTLYPENGYISLTWYKKHNGGVFFKVRSRRDSILTDEEVNIIRKSINKIFNNELKS